MEELIKNNPNYKLLSKSKLYQKAKEHDISKKEVDDYLESKEIYQVYKTQPRRTKLKITAPPYSFQIDIVELPKYKSSNNGIYKMLFIIDILSRKIWIYPLKKSDMNNVIDKYMTFLEEMGEPAHSVAGDDFFNNPKFKEINDELYIELYTDVAKDDHLIKGGDKLGILDRAVRTIKKLIEKYMLENQTTKWTSFIDDIVELYNDTPNVGIKNMTPNEVFDDYDYSSALHENQQKENQAKFDKVKIKVGDRVRLALGKGTFEKEKQKFSTEIYKVKSISGYRFVIEDESDKELKRKYRADELQIVKSVEDKIDDKTKKKVESRHKKTKVLSKELDVSYENASKKLNPPKKAKVKKISKKLDRFEDD